MLSPTIGGPGPRPADSIGTAATSKHHYLALDGLRGLAAVAVMAFHRRDWFPSGYFFGHAFLAVDFFFLLSGFVIALAYHERLQTPGSFRPFMRDRIFRLHPMLVVGAIIAAMVALLDGEVRRIASPADIAGMTIAQIIPFPILTGKFEAAFPLNIAIWSLFWEYVVNILYALTARYLTRPVLIGIVAVSIAVMAYVSATHNGFQVGFARDPSQFLWGFPRVCASFFLGVLISRTMIGTVRCSWTVGVAGTILLLVTFCLVPFEAPVSAIYDPLIAYLVYPILLIVLAGSEPFHEPTARLLGLISYPLYIIHEPTLRLVGGVLRTVGLSDGHPSPIEAVGRFAAVVLAAYVILICYEDPVRRRLKRLVKKRQ